ncbi:hypothetical protein ITJ86_17100 [Winogradskyella sp. F6397]|uniref:GLPGLI family protein n=1 Tax=Winogradskyella marina TaxID=2785530 RepID=A0ABS0EMC4_9FLAO|nr:hypothetical protein [Winogradskyella marina]MBF8151619.1 hypothetical protein [Winogradskyella marina]
MKYILFSISLFFFLHNSFCQEKRVYLFEEVLKPINDFQLNFFIKDSLSIYKSNNRNSFLINHNKINSLDSVIITYDSFYSQKLDLDVLKKLDTIVLNKQIHLDEVVIKKQFERKELGAVSKNRNLKKLGSTSTSENIIQLEVNDYKGAQIESISIYIYEKFRDLYNTKFINENIDIKFYLFQSNESPNNNTENLLKNELIVNTEKGEKGWLSIDLKDLNIKIKDYKYLYIGYSTFGSPIALGIIKTKKLDNNIIKYGRGTFVEGNRQWRLPKIIYNKKEVSIPAIKIKIKQ